MKIAVIGNSHIGSLKRGMDMMKAKEVLYDLCFFGARGGVFQRACGLRFRALHDLVGALASARARFRHEPFGLPRRFPHHPLAFPLRFLETARGGFRLAHSLGDLLPALVDDLQDWLVEEVRQNGQKQAEVEGLHEEQFPIDAECRK